MQDKKYEIRSASGPVFTSCEVSISGVYDYGCSLLLFDWRSVDDWKWMRVSLWIIVSMFMLWSSSVFKCAVEINVTNVKSAICSVTKHQAISSLKNICTSHDYKERMLCVCWPVDEVFHLQILHSRGDLCGHVEEHHSVHLLAVTLTQIIQQIPMSHELCDDVKGRFPCAHACYDTQTRKVCQTIQMKTIPVCCK